MLTVGLLWYDADSKATLEARVQRAADYYAEKYGQRPNCAFVHPSHMGPDGAPKLIGGVRVKASKTVIKHHFYLGIADAKETSAL